MGGQFKCHGGSSVKFLIPLAEAQPSSTAEKHLCEIFKDRITSVWVDTCTGDLLSQGLATNAYAFLQRLRGCYTALTCEVQFGRSEHQLLLLVLLVTWQLAVAENLLTRPYERHAMA